MNIDDMERTVNSARDGNPVSIAAVVEHGLRRDGIQDLNAYAGVPLDEFNKFLRKVQEIKQEHIEDLQDRVAFNAIMFRIKNSGNMSVSDVSADDNPIFSL